MRWPWFGGNRERTIVADEQTAIELINQSESVRQQLLDIAEKTSAYTVALQAELRRLQTIANQVKDD